MNKTTVATEVRFNGSKPNGEKRKQVLQIGEVVELIKTNSATYTISYEGFVGRIPFKRGPFSIPTLKVN